jgi:UDP-N-acetylglucosamine 2-epimerase (non-hydrolysing)
VKPTRRKIWVLVGTRPEVIKQAPVYIACREQFGPDAVALIGTGQHRELLDQALAHFDLELDEDLGIMREGQTPTSSAAAILSGLEPLLLSDPPEWIVVQGDTTSAAMAAWAAFHAGVRVGHNEAGLRTYDLAQPFPEEANRKLISVVADEHFAPTEHARRALLAEGCADERIHVTGNPGIDALRMTLAKPQPPRVTELLEDSAYEGREIVLMTAHRRENRGKGMDEWFATLRDWLEQHLDLDLVYPMHPNRAGYAAAVEHLDRRPQVRLIEPLDYAETCHLLRHSRFTITDSGGIQEEGATLGVPVVVCRRVTERPEAVDVGAAYLASTDAAPLRLGLDWAYEHSATRDRDTFDPIFGDGQAGPRIARLLAERLG